MDIAWSPDGEDPMSKLILGSTDIDILKSLSRTHGNKAPNAWSADFIPGKGEGQIFLLHGKLRVLLINIDSAYRIPRSSGNREDIYGW
jgi:hypothetical protein